MHIGKYLKKKREEMGYSQERLGELVEVSERTIRRNTKQFESQSK